MLSRREILWRAGQFGSVAFFWDRLPGFVFPYARAEGESPDNPPHFFVLVKTFGGLDCTLGLDPQTMPAGADERDLFLEYRPTDVLDAGEIRLGPAARALHPLAKEKAFSILNGISMRRDAGHTAGNQYALTGRGDGKAAAVAVELAVTTGSGPFGVVMNRSTYLAERTMILSATSDLLAYPNSRMLVQLLEQQGVVNSSPLGEAKRALIRAKDSAGQLSERLEHLKQKGAVSDAQVIAAAFASGAARQAQLDLEVGAGLDTHANHEGTHLRLQTQIWNQVADLFRIFQNTPCGEKSLFDFTTFLVISEFSRTPFLNGAKGKDHNPYTNSMVIAGRGIIGGKVNGASQLIPRTKTPTEMAVHAALPLKNGIPCGRSDGGRFIFPENVIRTVSAAFGSPEGFSSVDPEVTVIPGVLK